MKIEDASRMLISSLTALYDEREAASISSLVMEKLTGMPKNLRIIHKKDLMAAPQEELFQFYLAELVNHRPVQYVLGEAWFGTMPFYVDEAVLIPRPETEELTDWLLKDISVFESGPTVIDIGTGSGCIAVYLKKKRKDLKIRALDVSEAALLIAKKNSELLDADLEFILCDILDQSQWTKIDAADVIISNPPYIPENQKLLLEKHVKDFEPELALFVPDADPIIFYKTIGFFAKQKLKPGGMVFLEIHHDYARDIVTWFRNKGFTLELRKDFSGNNRMIKAQRI